jgi:homospermidine synthase
MMMGTKKLFYQYGRVRDCDYFDYYISLLKHSIDCKEIVYSPQGKTEGYIVTHEEVFSISHFFSTTRYRPTVFFVYSPCQVSLQSVVNNRDYRELNYSLLKKEHCSFGGESVGIIIQGKHFSTRYFGNHLLTKDLNETATVLQVSASAFSAFKYMIAHPTDGFLWPEELNHIDILNYANPFLKDYVSIECPSMIPVLGRF